MRARLGPWKTTQEIQSLDRSIYFAWMIMDDYFDLLGLFDVRCGIISQMIWMHLFPRFD